MNSSPEGAYLRLRSLFERLRLTPSRDPEMAARARDQFLARIDALGPPNISAANIQTYRARALRTSRPLAWATSILVAVAVFLGGTGVAFASQNALPAEPLYPVKIALEDLQLSLSSDEIVDAYLVLQYIQRRVDEISSLAEEERFDFISIPVAGYSRNLLQLDTIIIGYMERNDPRAQELISQLAEALADNERVFLTLLETAPASANSDLQLAIQVSRDVSQTGIGTKADEFPMIKDIEPDKGQRGQTLSVEITGEDTHFSAASVVSFTPADGIHVNRIIANSSTSLTVSLTVADSATLGDRQVAVITQDETASGEDFRIEEGELEDNAAGEDSLDSDELGEAQLKDIDPDKGQQGQTLTVVIVGEDTHFSSSSIVNFGPGVMVNGVYFQSSIRLEVNVTIDGSAALGDRAVSVTTGSEVAAGREFRVESAADDQSDGGGGDGGGSDDGGSGDGGGSDDGGSGDGSGSDDGGSGDGGGSDDGGDGDGSDEGEEIRFTGTVQSMSGQMWTIGGQQVEISPQTEIDDDLSLGDVVDVRALLLSDGSLVAERIELAD